MVASLNSGNTCPSDDNEDINENNDIQSLMENNVQFSCNETTTISNNLTIIHNDLSFDEGILNVLYQLS